jgi:hypothetical protein
VNSIIYLAVDILGSAGYLDGVHYAGTEYLLERKVGGNMVTIHFGHEKFDSHAVKLLLTTSLISYGQFSDSCWQDQNLHLHVSHQESRAIILS